MAEPGRNLGVTGAVVDIDGTAQFWAQIYKWGRQNSASPKTRTKRGDTWPRFRQPEPNANFILSGKVRKDGFYMPATLRGAGGEVQLVFDNEAMETFDVMVTDVAIATDAKEQDVWDIKISCVLTSPPVLAGFEGTQQTITAPASNVAEVHLGVTKGVDPDTIADNDVRAYDFESLTDTDAGETSAILAVIASAVATRAAMKIRRADYARDDAFGGTLQLTFARTTTAEDIINQATYTSIDPNLLGSQAATAAINGTPPAPTGAPFKLRSLKTNELNDNNMLSVADYGLRDTKDDVEMEGTFIQADPFELEPASHVTIKTSLSNPPDVPTSPTPGAVYIDTLTRQLVPGQYSHTFLYGPRTTADDAIFPHQWTLSDPGDLDSEGEVAAIGSTPTVPVGFYNRGVTGHYLTNSGKILQVMKFGRRSTTQDLEMEHTVSEGDPFEGTKTKTATVISNTNTASAIAQANFSTAVTFDGVSVKRLNDAKALLIQATRDNPRIVVFEMRSPGEEPVRGYVFAGSAYVYVRQIYQRANYWEYELAPQPLPLLRMRFGIRRRQTGEPIDMEWTLAGSANLDGFLGLPQGTVAYRGINGQHNYTNGGPADIFHEFEYLLINVGGFNVTGHIYYGKANLGWHRTEQDLSGITPGSWVRATTLYELDQRFDAGPYPLTLFGGVLA